MASQLLVADCVKAGLSLRDARLFNAVLYCSIQQDRSDGFAHNTHEGWTKIARISEKQFRAALIQLTEMQLIARSVFGAGRSKKTALRPLVKTSKELVSALKNQGTDKSLSVPSGTDNKAKGTDKGTDKRTGKSTDKGTDATIYTLTCTFNFTLVGFAPTPFPAVTKKGPKADYPGNHYPQSYPVQEAITPMKIADIMADLRAKQQAEKAEVQDTTKPIVVTSAKGFYDLYRRVMRAEANLPVRTSPAASDWGKLKVIWDTLADTGIDPHKFLSTLVKNWASAKAHLESTTDGWKLYDRPDLFAMHRYLDDLLAWFEQGQKAQNKPASAPKALTPSLPTPAAPAPVQQAPVSPFAPKPWAGMSEAESLHHLQDFLEGQEHMLEQALSMWKQKGWVIPAEYATSHCN